MFEEWEGLPETLSIFLPFSEMTSTVSASCDLLQWCYFWWEQAFFSRRQLTAMTFWLVPSSCSNLKLCLNGKNFKKGRKKISVTQKMDVYFKITSCVLPSLEPKLSFFSSSQHCCVQSLATFVQTLAISWARQGSFLGERNMNMRKKREARLWHCDVKGGDRYKS